MAERAARVGDPVEHTHKEGMGIALAVVGAAIGAAVVIATAPVSVTAAVVLGGIAVVSGTTMAGKALGELVGSHAAAPNAGDIADGAHSVFTGPGQPKAARMSDPVKCHSGQKIADGSDSVFIEKRNASRKGDGTECDGKIQDGCASVLIGGGAIGAAGSADRTELSSAYRFTFGAIDWAGTIAGLAEKEGIKELALPLAGAVVKGYEQLGLPGGEQVGKWGGALIEGAELVTGKGKISEWTATDWTDHSATVVGSGSEWGERLTSPEEPHRTY